MAGYTGCLLWSQPKPPANADRLCHANTQVHVPVLQTEARLSFLQRDGVDFVFVQHPSYQRQGLYSDHQGVYGDNQVDSSPLPSSQPNNCSALLTILTLLQIERPLLQSCTTALASVSSPWRSWLLPPRSSDL